MTIREIHNNLLSLFLRGLGVWLLFGASDRVISYAGTVIQALTPHEGHSYRNDLILYGLLTIVHVLVAGYFMLGAPPFLKWATQANPPVDRP